MRNLGIIIAYSIIQSVYIIERVIFSAIDAFRQCHPRAIVRVWAVCLQWDQSELLGLLPKSSASKDVIRSTESSSSSPRTYQVPLNGHVQLIVLLAPRKEFELVAEKTEGIKNLARGVYLVKLGFQPAGDLVRSIRHVSFKKTRQIPRVRESGPGETENRAYTVVAYRFDSPTAQQKKQAQRLIRRSPCIRLRPGVLLFPHLRAKEFARYYGQETKHSLYNAKTFVVKMTENGAVVRRWSRLKLVESNSEELVGPAIDRMVSREMSSIESRLTKLRDVTVRPGASIRKLKERYTVLARRFRVLKANFLVVQSIWHHDTEKQLRRTYNILLRVKREIAAVIDSSSPAGVGLTARPEAPAAISLDSSKTNQSES